MKKQQQMPEEFFGKEKKTDEHYNTQQKPTDSNKMVTVDTVEKSWKNLVINIVKTLIWQWVFHH